MNKKMYHVSYRVMVDRTVAVNASSEEEAERLARAGEGTVEEEEDDAGVNGERIEIQEVYEDE